MNKVLFSSENVEWSTPQDFFDKLNAEFGFTLDPCSTHENAKCEKHYTKDDDGLKQDWSGETVFCNPPYARGIVGSWAKKCYEESLKPNTTVVLLINARTDAIWFHDWVYGKAELRFVRGRLHFGGKNRAPFPSLVAIYK